jgi:hypothetical protein
MEAGSESFRDEHMFGDEPPVEVTWTRLRMM